MDTARLESALRDAGLKATRGRVAVLEALTDRPHANAETVFRTLLPTLPGTSIQNVHNVLGDLTAAGLLRRIEPAGSAALYERRIGDNHHHVVCTGCGAVADVDCVVGHAPCLHPSDAGGFAIDTAEVTFWGLCPSCQERAARAQQP
ncbi:MULTISPECIES: Fur family transcriptional regulator [unclassified Leifsonia]|uniref:Fur family transcriptional regulator n=1 Tax=unclassified Leifsonia TaxID=2663824 RepID=UPI00036D4B92|nr:MULTISPECIES: Fur family transcriptional regulator [unclassified Leifsonia]TDQ02479.1 Fur family ferric uptake transcriptional regulator [Leifsonia sp. 115AMFTsu3.1]